MKFRFVFFLFLVLLVTTVVSTSCLSWIAKTISTQEEPSKLEASLCGIALKISKSLEIINKDSGSIGASFGEMTGNLAQAYQDDSRYLYSADTEKVSMKQNVVFVSMSQNISEEERGTPPESFLEPIPEDGYINTPTGSECPLGATTEMMFETKDGENLVLDYIEELGAKVIPYEIFSAPDSDPSSLQSFINCKISSENRNFADPSYWNREIWGTEGDNGIKSMQDNVESIIDYYFWSTSPELEVIMLDAIKEKLSTATSQQVVDAFDASNKSGWVGYPIAQEGDKISRMNIKAEFDGSGNVSGTVYESREFSIDASGELEFGVLKGSGELTIISPSIGEVIFNTELEWTKWNEMGAPTEGVTTLTNEENGYMIEIFTNSDGTKNGNFYVNGKQVGKVTVDIDRHSTYIDIETNTETEIQ
jgi:hypothetical protein